MKKIYTLPTNLCYSSKWIEENNCNLNLSEIKVTDSHCIVPVYIYEDSLVDCDSLTNKELEFGAHHVKYPISFFYTIQNARKNSFKACQWYPEIKDKIPTAESIIFEIVDRAQVLNVLTDNLTDYPFVRLCNASPKDMGMPIYSVPQKALSDLQNSNRTCLFKSGGDCTKGCHLFLRKLKIYNWEARCFWSKDKLTAVSLPFKFTKKEKAEILDFFCTYKNDIPYHSCTVDIGKSSNSISLIEFNTFGPDMKATSGNFNWYEDVYLLLNSEKPIFKYATNF